MKTYIDFDGVIMDTETHLFDEKKAFKAAHPGASTEDYLVNKDWDDYLSHTDFIDGSLEYLDNNPDAIILTKVWSIKEAKAKFNILREYNIFNDIVFVPFGVKKVDLVEVYNCILVDDTVHNLDEWQESGGIGIYFNKDNKLIDPWKNVNTKYIMIDSLKCLVNNERKRNK